MSSLINEVKPDRWKIFKFPLALVRVQVNYHHCLSFHSSWCSVAAFVEVMVIEMMMLYLLIKIISSMTSS
jgi:hypothetical protein